MTLFFFFFFHSHPPSWHVWKIVDYLFCSVAKEHLEAVSEVCIGGVGEKEGAWSQAHSPDKHHCAEAGERVWRKGHRRLQSSLFSSSSSEHSKDDSQSPGFHCGARAQGLRLFSEQHGWESIAAVCVQPR